MKKTLLFLLLICGVFVLSAQTKKVLFLGNSYTYYNDLPQLLYDMVISTGDDLIFDSRTQGGATLFNHANSADAMTKINSNNWDYVVIQGQSQEPALSDNYVEFSVFPYAAILSDSIRANDPCSRPVFFMTWGRKNGDGQNCANWPPVCTYEGMDSLLNLRYRMMGDFNAGYVSPVGAVWHYLRDNNPEIELYNPDLSHPLREGSYAAACTFYAILYQKDPNLITFDYSLTAEAAAAVRAAAKTVVFDNLAYWNVGSFLPDADFEFIQNDNEITFTNNSFQATNYTWDFGDGTFSDQENPIHVYQNPGMYQVALIATECGKQDTIIQEVDITIISNNDILEKTPAFVIFPNPISNNLLQIEFKDFNRKEAFKIYITNMEEKVVKEMIINPLDHFFQVDIANLPSGVYVVKDGNGKFAPQLFSKN